VHRQHQFVLMTDLDRLDVPSRDRLAVGIFTQAGFHLMQHQDAHERATAVELGANFGGLCHGHMGTLANGHIGNGLDGFGARPAYRLSLGLGRAAAQRNLNLAAGKQRPAIVKKRDAKDI